MSLRALAGRLGIRRARGGANARGETLIKRDRKLIEASGLFDAEFYLKQSPELSGKKIVPIDHYLRRGVAGRRNPSRAFDTGFYLDSNPDVARGPVNPLVHFIELGRKQGRRPTAEVEDWDALAVPTATAVPTVEGSKRIYLVPAYLAERNTTRYRAHHLVELLTDADITIVDHANPPEDFFTQLERGAIVILQRLAFSPKTESFLTRIKESPALIVYDIDDQVFDPNELEDWRIDGLDTLPWRYVKCMGYADHFFVSTTRLRDKVERRFQRPAHVIANCLNRAIVSNSLAVARPPDDGRFVIGYASGSGTHDEDLKVVLPALERFLRAKPNAEFHCIGYMQVPKSLQQEFGSRIVHRPAVSWKNLPEELARFSVQIIPLVDCSFNQYKSHIRFLESAAVGVPVIVSAVSELAKTVIHEQTGLVCRNETDAWYSALQKLSDDSGARSRIGESARHFVTTYFTTQSRFLRARARRVIEDLELGVCRDKVSVIVVTYSAASEVIATLDAVYRTTQIPFEVCVWNNSSDPETRAYLDGLTNDNLLVVHAETNVGKAKGANYLFGIVTERFVCGLDDDYVVPELWDVRMIHAAKTVPNLGWLSTNLSSDSSGLRDRGVVDSFPGGASVLRPASVGGWVMFTTASARQKIGLYPEDGFHGAIDADYNRRARQLGLYTGYVRRVVGYRKRARIENVAWQRLRQRIRDETRIHGRDSDKFISSLNARPDHPCVAIKICTSVMHDENVWGDTHFAFGLGASLDKLGYQVRIDKQEAWYDTNGAATDIVIHLFGLQKYKPDERHLNILWIISHPDLIDADFLYGFDSIFCASEAISARVRALVPEVKVETLLQCTDTEVFFPDEQVEKDLDVVFVGNSRRVYREAVRYAVEGGFDLAIWGTRWEPFVDERHIRGLSLTSQEVGDIYRRAKVVLNDHWDDQKREGLVNNRIFDVLACNTTILSDANPGLPTLFDGKVPTFTDRESFVSILRRLLDSNDRDRLAADLGAQTRENHTFDQRAQALHAAVTDIVRDYVAYKSELLWSVRRKREGSARPHPTAEASA